MKEKINNVIFEAKRFIKKAELWNKRINEDKYALISGSKEGGAAKRASLDLTRALSNLRNNK